MKLLIHPMRWSRKPVNGEIGMLKNQILSYPVDVTVRQLADELLLGKTVLPAVLEGSGAANDSMWISQQVFMVDVDDGIPYQEAVELYQEYGMNPAFIYETFSSTTDNIRYRIVFISDIVVNDTYLRGCIMKHLLSIIGSADTQCVDASRIFFGGTRLLWQNFNNVFPVELIPPMETSDITEEVRKGYPNNNILIIRGGYSSNAETIRFTNYNDAIYHLTHEVDLQSYLNLPNSKNIKCINPEHEDHNPSANVMVTENGEQYYKCFGCNWRGNIITMVQRIRGINRRDAVLLLMNEFNIAIEDTPQSLILKINKSLFTGYDDTIKVDNPKLYNVIRYYYEQINGLHDIALENIHCGLTDKEGNPIFFASKATLSKRYHKESKKTTQVTNLLAFLKLLTKESDQDIPIQALQKAIALARKNEHKQTVQFYSIPNYTPDLLDEAERRADIYKSNGGTVDSLSREFCLRVPELGEDVANEVYPKQEGKPLQGATEKYHTMYENIILSLVNVNGYCTEDMILDNVAGNRDNAKVRLRRCLAQILADNNLQRIRANNRVKATYGIKSSGYPMIIIKC